MSTHLTGRRAFAGLALVLTAQAAGAQSIGGLIPFPHLAIGGVGSTLGFGGDVALGIGRYTVVRASKTGGSIGADRPVQDQSYNLFAKADNRALMVDLHLFGGGIYVSAGKVDNRSTLSLTGVPSNGQYTFNGTSYDADSVGTLSGAIKLPSNPMFYGFGWDHTFGNRWPASIVSRFGVLHQERAQLALSASGPFGQASNPSHAGFQAALDAERTKQEQSLDTKFVRNLPVMELGLRMRLF
jgi:hypothetical protein